MITWYGIPIWIFWAHAFTESINEHKDAIVERRKANATQSKAPSQYGADTTRINVKNPIEMIPILSMPFLLFTYFIPEVSIANQRQL